MKEPNTSTAGDEGSGPWSPPRPLTLPPNTDLAKFQDFMQQIKGIVGAENATIISSDADLQHEDYMNPSKAYDVRALARVLQGAMPTRY